MGGLGLEERLAPAQAGWSWKARARQGGQPRLARGLPIPRAPRVSAVSIWPSQLFFLPQRIAGVSSAVCQVLFLKSQSCGCFCGWVEGGSLRRHQGSPPSV